MDDFDMSLFQIYVGENVGEFFDFTAKIISF